LSSPRISARGIRWFIALLVVSSSVLALMFWNPWVKREDYTPSAAIYDPLSEGGVGFSAECSDLFKSAGYDVEVCSGGDVTVGGLKATPPGVDVLILRVHSSVYHGRVWFFTGETYRQEAYVLEQLLDEVHPARPSVGSDYLFAVGADFLLHYLDDSFDGTLVVLMGCDGLSSTDLAVAFIEAGASAYVSWDGPVSLEHTDRATLVLLRLLVEERVRLDEAVDRAMAEAGPDPDYGSSLKFTPEDAGSLVLGPSS